MKTELLERCRVCGGGVLGVVEADCNLMPCRASGPTFDNPIPVLKELISFYSRPTRYNSWLTLRARNRLWKRRLRKLQLTKMSPSAPDEGTGIGQFLSLARRSYTEAYGAEASRTTLQAAKQK